MFHSARLKLTGWYLLIIMFISISFSAVIYGMLTREVERFSRMQRSRIERRLRPDIFPPSDFPLPAVPIMDPDLLNETSHRIFLMLVIINGTIFILSGGLGYILAGRTLQPIAKMIDEQNRFIQDSSHELRTPLTSLKSALEVHLRDKQLTLKTAKTVMNESILEVNKLQTLSDSLLALTQYQKPNQNISQEAIPISQIISQAIHTILPQATAKKITIVDQSKKYLIRGNKESLIELFVILLDNAVKYSPEKTSVFVKTTYTDHYIDVIVSDSGIGIAREHLSRIFDRFYRADNARSKNNTSGYGLGLSIAKSIATHHNGTIRVSSTLHKGSVFTVRFPMFS